MDNRYTRFMLAAIVMLLALLVIRQYETPTTVRAAGDELYVEPGYTMLRSPDGLTQVKGKIVINLNSGEIWGFPTLVDGPYPVDIGGNKPPVSKPIYLGLFDLTAMRR
jgi:hypothetical protein